MSPAFGEETQHAVIHQWINNGPSVGSTAHTRTFNLPASGLGKNDQGACHYLFSFLSAQYPFLHWRTFLSPALVILVVLSTRVYHLPVQGWEGDLA